MPGRSSSPRRSSEYAWLITSPLAVIAMICVATWWISDDDWYRSWPAGLASLAALIVANLGVLNVVIRRQAFGLVVTEIPLVLTLFFLPPVMVVLVVTSATLI